MKMTISKLDAAKRQLETVIRLYFSNADPVAIHSLTAGAYNILRDVTAKRGAEPMFVKGTMLDYVKEDHRDLFSRKINEAENFFKHADRDHDSSLDFDPIQSEMLLIDACGQYQKLTGELLPLVQAFRCWFMATHPDFFIFPEEQKRLIRANAPEIVAMGRAGFFNMVLPILMRAGV